MTGGESLDSRYPSESSVMTTEKFGAPTIKSDETQKYITFALFGFLSLFTLYVSIAEAVIYERLYEGYKYTFYVSVPSYIAILPNLLVTRICKNFSIKTQFIIGLTGTGIGIIGVSTIPFFMERDSTGKFG